MKKIVNFIVDKRILMLILFVDQELVLLSMQVLIFCILACPSWLRKQNAMTTRALYMLLPQVAFMYCEIGFSAEHRVSLFLENWSKY